MARSRRLTASEAKAELSDPVRRFGALKRLPEDVDAEFVTDVLFDVIGGADAKSFWLLAGSGRELPVSVIRTFLTRLARTGPKSAAVVFLLEAVPLSHPSIDEAWRSALVALLDLLSSYDMGAKQLRPKLEALANDPLLLSAVQAAVAHDEDLLMEMVGMKMVGVLALDGSAASSDAILPVVLWTQRHGGPTLAHLQRVLAKFAPKTPEMKAMHESIAERRSNDERSSPALSFARSIGLDVKRIEMWVSVWAQRGDGTASVRIDSSRSSWLEVEASLGGRKTAFTERGVEIDSLELGACDVEAMPSWLARVQTQLGVRWGPPSVLFGSLRAKNHARFIEWLLGPSYAASRTR